MTDTWKPTPGRDAMTADGRRVTDIERNSRGLIIGNIEHSGRYVWFNNGHYRVIGWDPLDLVRDADPLPAEPDKDGWIKHDGGPCPVPPDTLVDIKFRAGHGVGCVRPALWNWGEATQYRIAQSASPAIPSPVITRTVREIVPGTYGRVHLENVSLNKSQGARPMTIDLSRIRATALAATPEFGRFFLAVPPEVERHIETMSPATTLALVDALIEWRDAVVAADEAYGRSADLEDYTAVLDRRNEAETALLALIGGKPEQETNNDAG